MVQATWAAPFGCSNPQPNLGGLSIWIPPTMVNAMALILVLDALLSQQDRNVPKDVTYG